MFAWLKSKNELISQIKELEGRLSKTEHEKKVAESEKTRAQEAQEKAEKSVSSVLELSKLLLHSNQFLTQHTDSNSKITLFEENRAIVRKIEEKEEGYGRSRIEYQFISMTDVLILILDLFKSGLTKSDILNWRNLRDAEKEYLDRIEFWTESSMKNSREKAILSEELTKERARIDLKAKLTINNLQYEAILVNNEGDGPQVQLHIENQKPIKCRLVDIEQIN